MNNRIYDTSSVCRETSEMAKPIDMFKTPLHCFNIDKSYPDIKKYCLEKESKYRRKDSKGFQYEIDLDKEPFHELVYHELNQCLNWSIWEYNKFNLNFKVRKAWLNVHRKGEYIMQHAHPEGDLSCTYYVDVWDDTGEICFRNPDYFMHMERGVPLAENAYNASQFTYKPKKWDFIVFKSHIEHEIRPNRMDVPRISIAFDVNYTEREQEES